MNVFRAFSIALPAGFALITTATAQAGETWSPRARDAAVVVVGNARFTFLSHSLIRMEWSPDGVFEDRASQVFVNRDLDVPRFQQSRGEDGALTIETAALRLTYTGNGRRFTADNLKIESRRKETLYTWHPGKPDTGNLKGTFRTLDGVSGATSLEPGILSRDGWVLIDDSKSLVFDKLETPILQADTWPRPRGSHRLKTGATDQRLETDATDQGGADQRSEAGASGSNGSQNEDALDWYFFGYGHDYKLALYDFTRVAGKIPLPPRYAFGLWWSRYWAYSDAELRELVAEFKQHDVPLDVLVIDMDWHLDGWTGYTWNPKYFPDPEGFLKWAHEQGLKVTLNLHPADGVGRHEAAFPPMCETMGLDPQTTEKIPFDCTDPKYVEAYFKHLHHPLEKIGIDFWWMDWQQGTQSGIPGLDPLWMLNWLHWNDMERRAADTGRRPLIFSRWGGLGNHRYQIGFSGDTFCNWSSLAFQPYFTATAGNVGYAYWSHDIGGHQPGPVDGELYARWIQWGCFSPILRTHTTKNPDAERRIWKFPPEVFEAARKAIHLRYELLPYIYTMARKCHDTGLPLCRPLYYEWPELDEAYQHGGQYMFGDDLLVAPVTEPADPISGLAMVKVWLPPGTWTNWFTGRMYDGPADVRMAVPLDEIPLFVRGGAIIPSSDQHVSAVPDPLVLNIFPGYEGKARVFEEQPETPDRPRDGCFWTPVRSDVGKEKVEVVIGPPEIENAHLQERRAFEVRFRDFGQSEVEVNGQFLDQFEEEYYRGRIFGMSVPTGNVPIDAPCQVDITYAGEEELASLRYGLRGLSYAIAQLDVLRMQREDPKVTYDAVEGSMYWSRKIVPNHEWGSPGTVFHYYLMYGDALLRDLFTQSDVVRRWLIRLHQLYYKQSVSFDFNAPDQMILDIEFDCTLPSEAKESLGLDIKIEGTEGLEHIGPRVRSFKPPLDKFPISEHVRLTSKANRSTSVIRSCLRIFSDSFDVEVPLESIILPSINAWHIAGPFDAGPMETSLAKKFPPEDGVDLSAEYDRKDGHRLETGATPNNKIKWRVVQREIKPGDDLTQEFFIDFDDVFGERVYNAVVYAFTYLDADEDTDAVLACGSDDGVVAWLNGKEVHRLDRGRPYTSKQDRVPVRLNKGENTLLLKINQGGGDWGFCVHVDTPAGTPHLGVRPRLKPETPKSQNVNKSKR